MIKVFLIPIGARRAKSGLIFDKGDLVRSWKFLAPQSGFCSWRAVGAFASESMGRAISSF